MRETNDEIDWNIERGYHEQLEEEWEREKRAILDALGFRSSATAAPRTAQQTAYSTPAKTVAGADAYRSAGMSASNLTPEQLQYGVLVRTLNRRRQQHQPYPLVTAVRDASLALSGVRGVSEVSELWSVVRYMVNEHDVVDEQYQRLALTESHYRLQWTDDSAPLKEQLVGQAMRYCEELFLAHVRSTAGSVEQYAVNAIQQSAAGDRVRDYLGPLPVWPVAFYLLRAGAKQEAVTHISKFNQQSPHADVSAFLSCLQHFAQSSSPFTSLPSQLHNSLHEIYNREFSQRAPSSVDPYKLALFTLLGRFTAPPGIDYMSYTAESTEAYLWYKLASLGSATALRAFQNDIITRGEAHFNADQQHALLYAKVLVLTQCFEQAVRYLLKAGWRDVGVNAMVVLRYYGLIRECEGDEVAVVNGDGLLCINTARIIEQYVNDTLLDDTELGFHYLYTLYPTDSSMYAMARLLVAGRVKSRMLIGEGRDVAGGGEGLFGEFLSREHRRQVILEASRLCEQRGEIVDAITLMRLADEVNAAATLATRELARVVTGDMRDPKRLRVVQLAQQLMAQPSAASTPLATLLSLVQFFDHYHLGAEHYDAALDALMPLQLLPLSAAQSSEASNRLMLLPTAVHRVVADVCLAVMDVYYHKYQQLMTAMAGGLAAGRLGEREAREGLRRQLRERVNALVNFVGLNQGSIGIDVHAKMLRLEALMS